VKLPSMRRHTNPWKTDCGPGAGLAAGKRQVPGGDYVLPGWIPPPRRKGDAHPGRISMARNIVIPFGVRRLATCGNPTARKGQSPAGTGVLKKRKPDHPGRGAATAKDCGGSKDIGKTAPILLPPAVVPPAWPRRACARRVRPPADRGGQVQVPHRYPRGAGPARILGAPAVCYCGRDARTGRRTWSGAWPAGTGCPTPCAALTPSREQARPSPP
jgi:hypothetical protein